MAARKYLVEQSDALDDVERIAAEELAAIEDHIYTAKREHPTIIGHPILVGKKTSAEDEQSRLIMITDTDAQNLTEIKAAKEGKKSNFDALVEVTAITLVSAEHDHRGRSRKTQKDYESAREDLTGDKIFKGEKLKAKALEFDERVFDACLALEDERESKKSQEQVLYDRFCQGIQLESQYLANISKAMDELSKLDDTDEYLDMDGFKLLNDTFLRMITALSVEEMNYYKKDFIFLLKKISPPEFVSEIEENTNKYCDTHFKLVKGINERSEQLSLEVLLKIVTTTVSGAGHLWGSLHIINATAASGIGVGAYLAKKAFDAKMDNSAPARSPSEKVILTLERIKEMVKENKRFVGLGITTLISLAVFPPLATISSGLNTVDSIKQSLNQRSQLDALKQEVENRKKVHRKEFEAYFEKVSSSALRQFLMRDVEVKTNPPKKLEVKHSPPIAIPQRKQKSKR